MIPFSEICTNNFDLLVVISVMHLTLTVKSLKTPPVKRERKYKWLFL